MSFNSGKTGAQVMAALAGGSGDSPISFKGNGTATEATPWRVTNISPNAKNFNFSLNTFPGVNLPAGDSRENNVFNMGWNVATNGAREDPTQAMLRITFEEHYVMPGKPAAFEFHLSSMDESGQEHRPISSYLHKDGSPGSDISLNVDVLNFNDYNYVQQMKFNFIDHTIDVVKGNRFRFNANNVPPVSQLNAEGTDYLGLPFYNEHNVLQLGGSTSVVGSTPQAGAYPNSFFTVNALSAAADGKLLDLRSGEVTGDYWTYDHGASASGSLSAGISNSAPVAGANSMYWIRVASSTAGDPFHRYTVNGGGAHWAVGMDNSDDDAFVWSDWLPGLNNAMRLDRNGTLSLPAAGGGLRVKEGSNCKQGVATLAAGTVTVANTSVTANSRIFLTGQADGGTPGFVRVSSRVPGTSFTITSSSGTDTSTVAYEIFEPA